jgi:hypothetical protein
VSKSLKISSSIGNAAKRLSSPGTTIGTDVKLRDVLEFKKLKALVAKELAERTRGYLSKDEVKAVMARRDKIVTRFQKMISEKGEKEVLY